MKNADCIDDLATLERWRSPENFKPTPIAKRWARRTFDLAEINQTLSRHPYAIACDGRTACIAPALVVPELIAMGVVVWRGKGDAASTGVSLTAAERRAVPRIAAWTPQLPLAARVFVVKFRDGALAATRLAPRDALPAEWQYRQWYIAAHANVAELES